MARDPTTLQHKNRLKTRKRTGNGRHIIKAISDQPRTQRRAGPGLAYVDTEKINNEYHLGTSPLTIMMVVMNLDQLTEKYCKLHKILENRF